VSIARTGLYCAALVISTVTGWAQTPPGVSIPLSLDGQARSDRLKYARAALIHVDAVRSMTPTLKPSEVEWLEGERRALAKTVGTSGTNRTILLVNSPEYQQERFLRVLNEAADALRCVGESSVVLKREIFCWAVASYWLGRRSDLDDAVRTLRQSGRLPKQSLAMPGNTSEDVDETLLGIAYGIVSREVQEQLVLPYLKGDLTR
jgi:hypothetical protein